jgi:hypothetical protein
LSFLAKDQKLGFAKHRPKDVERSITRMELRKYRAHRFLCSKRVGILPVLCLLILIIILLVIFFHISPIAHSLPMLVDGFMVCD